MDPASDQRVTGPQQRGCTEHQDGRWGQGGRHSPTVARSGMWRIRLRARAIRVTISNFDIQSLAKRR